MQRGFKNRAAIFQVGPKFIDLSTDGYKLSLNPVASIQLIELKTSLWSEMTMKVCFGLYCGNPVHSVAKYADFHADPSTVKTQTSWLYVGDTYIKFAEVGTNWKEWVWLFADFDMKFFLYIYYNLSGRALFFWIACCLSRYKPLAHATDVLSSVFQESKCSSENVAPREVSWYSCSWRRCHRYCRCTRVRTHDLRCFIFSRGRLVIIRILPSTDVFVIR